MKAKNLLSLVCAAVLCCAGASLAGCGNGAENSTEPPTEGLEYTLNDDGKSYSVTGIGSATETKIVISAEYEGKPVTDIGKGAFEACRTITSVTVPDSVTIIKTAAFANCSALQEVKLSSKLEELWQNVFLNCEKLESVTLPDSLMSVGDKCFYTVDGDKLPNFKYTEKDGAQYVGTANNPYHALVGMAKTGLYNAVEIHKDTKVIADGAFDQNYTTLQNIYFPQELTGINVPRYLFRRLSGLNVNLENGRFSGKYLGTNPDAANQNPYVVIVESVPANSTLADGVKIVTSEGLTQWFTQTKVVIPDGVDSIGEYTFYDFRKLEQVTLPSSLKILPRYVFGKCHSLTDITFKGTKAQWNSLKKSSLWNANTADYTIHCTDGDIAKV